MSKNRLLARVKGLYSLQEQMQTCIVTLLLAAGSLETSAKYHETKTPPDKAAAAADREMAERCLQASRGEL